MSTTSAPSLSLGPAQQWTPPPAVRAAGETARVRNTQGTQIAAGEAAQKPVSPALTAFYEWILAHFPGTTGGGRARASSRNHTVGQRRDVHEEGRAGDFMVAQREPGERLANWLVLNAEALGVQLVIFWRTEWSSSNIGAKWEDYRSPPAPSSHTDHVHAELSVAAAAITPAEMTARLEAAWARNPPPTSGGAGGGAGGGSSSGILRGIALAALLAGALLAGAYMRDE